MKAQLTFMENKYLNKIIPINSFNTASYFFMINNWQYITI